MKQELHTTKELKLGGVLSKVKAGDEVGGYTILEEIARGGMGVVYRAQHKEIHQEVAIKVLLEEAEEGSIAVKRFLREAKATAALQHPGIVPIYNMGKFYGCYYLAMKYIRGTTFSNYIHSDDVSLNDKLNCFIKICNALDYAHKQGIIHRDLKPANILVDENKEPWITDFGLAKIVSHSISQALTVEGSILGTPSYMSPQQIAGERVGVESDIYSMGVVLFEALTKRLPFYASNINQLIRQVTSDLPPPPSSINKEIKPEFDSVCLKAMAKKPKDRYISAKSLALDVKKVLAGKKVKRQKNSFLYYFQRYRKVSLISAVFLSVLMGGFAIWGAIQYQAEKESVRQSRENVVVSKFCLKARQAIEQGEFAKGEKLLQQVVKRYPLNSLGYLEMALLQQHMGDIPQAKKYLDRALRISPQQPEVLMGKVRIYIVSREFEKALKYIDKYLKQSPTSQGYREKGKILQMMGQLDAAQINFSKAEMIDRKKLSHLLDKAKKLSAMSALAVVQEILDQSPSYEEALFFRAKLYFETKQMDLALIDTLSLLKNRETIEYLILQARCLKKLGNSREACSVYEEILSKRLAKNQDNVRLELANLYFEVQEFEKATQEYQKVFRDGKNTPVEYLLKMIEASLNIQKYHEPKKWIDTLLLKNDSESLGAGYYFLGLIKLEQRGFKKAREYFRKSLEYDSKYKNLATRDLGYTYFEIKKWKNARRFLIRVKPQFSEDIKFCWFLGYTHCNLGEWGKAIPLLTTCIEQEPWADHYYFKRAEAYKELQNYDSWEKDLTTVNQLNPEKLEVITDLGETIISKNIIDYYLKVDFLQDVFVTGSKFRFQIYPDLFDEAIQDVGQVWLKKSLKLSMAKKKDSGWTEEQLNKLLHSVQSTNEVLREFALKQLQEMYYDPRVLKALKIERKKTNPKVIQERFDQIYELVYAKYKQEMRILFRGYLFRYYYARDQQGLLAIYLTKELGEEVLADILMDDSESSFARFFAAKALNDLCNASSRKILSRIIEQGELPCSQLFAISAQKDIPTHQDFFQKQYDVFLSGNRIKSNFTKSLFIQNIPVSLKTSLEKTCQKIKEPVLKLQILKRLREFGTLNSSEFTLFFQDPNPVHQAFALASYWDFKGEPKKHKFYEVAKKNIHYLTQKTRHKDPRVRRVAFLRLADFHWKKARKVLAQNIYEENSGTRFAIIMRLAQRGEFSFLMPVMFSEKESLTIRAAVLSAGKESLTRFMGKASALFEKVKSRCENGRKSEIITSVGMMGAFERRLKGFTLLKKYFQSKNPYTRLAATIAAWGPKSTSKKYEKEMAELTKDPHPEVKQAAILATTFNLNQKYSSLDEKSFLETMMKDSLEYRKSAALGYRYTVFLRMHLLGGGLQRALFWNYDLLYREYLTKFYQKAKTYKSRARRRFIGYLDTSIHLYQGYSNAFVERGILKLADENFAQAIQDFQKAVAMDKEAILPKVWLAKAYNLSGVDKGIPVMEEIVEQLPWDLEVVTTFCNALEQDTTPEGQKRYVAEQKRLENLQEVLTNK